MPPDDPSRFDDAYYSRFYGEDGAHDPVLLSHLATAVHHMAAWWGITVRSVLDVGAGMGMWRDWYVAHHPGVFVQSIDTSEHACATWGHDLLDISKWRPSAPFDLVICHSVLQYIDDEPVARAIENLGAATRHVLYLEIPTTADLAQIVDPDRTDLDLFSRTGDWYRALLDPYFRQVGAGLWVRQRGLPMYELEASR